MPIVRYTPECLEAAEGRYPVGPDGKRPVTMNVAENWLIENFFGRAHPITPGVWFGPLIAYGVWRGLHVGGAGITAANVGTTVLCFLAGFLIWTLSEYLLHRYLFHFTAKTQSERLQLFLLHGYHHAFPNDKTRLVAPPWMSWPVGAAFFAAYWLALPTHDLAWLFFAGTCAGYIAYDWTHYYTHHFKPTTSIGRWIRAYHLQHHFADENSRYGVSSPLWDLVFGTFTPPVRASAAASNKTSH